MIFKVQLELAHYAVKVEAGFADSVYLYIDCTGQITAASILDSLKKNYENRKVNPDRYKDTLRVMEYIIKEVQNEFDDPEDFIVEISKDYEGREYKFTEFTLTIIELFVTEHNGHDNT